VKLRGLTGRAIRFVWWRLYLGLSMPALGDRLARRWGWAARRIRMALPHTPPYRRRELHLLRNIALGDVLLCTSAVRELKRCNPSCHVTFYTDFPTLITGLPFIDQVRPADEADKNALRLTYEKSLPPRRHLAKLMGDHLGLNVRDVRPSCILDSVECARFREAWKDRPRPWIIVNRHASSWTPNKEWPGAHWEALIDRLLSWASVIEIGHIPHPNPGRDPERYLSLIGRTSLNQLVASIAAADLHVGPISGPTHIAAAFRVPAVVIYGGYEHPVCTSYEKNINLYSPVPCAPCWLRDSCPYGKKCLHQITPADVEDALKKLWDNITG
jgi:ADP-heptose:LPS heptosyltransferase